MTPISDARYFRKSPSATEVKFARQATGMTQSAAAASVGITSVYRWSEIERGVAQMHPGLWELFLIKTGIHPEFGARMKSPAKAIKAA